MNLIEFPKLGLAFDINPVAFTVGNFQVRWYGIIIAVGMVLAILYASRVSRRLGVDPDHLLDCVIGGVVGGIIGARLYYVLFNMKEFHSIWDVFNIKSGGLAIYGGIIGGFAVGLVIAMWRKVSIPKVCDVAALGLLIGQGIGRWGNFVNQEAFGINTDLPWGMTGTHISSYLHSNFAELTKEGMDIAANQPVHPCFLYESLWCILLFVVLHFVSKRRRYPGEIFLLYVAGYGFERFFVEGLRTDSLYIPGTYLRVSQILAGVAFVVAIIVHIIILVKVKKSQPDENDSYQPVFGSMELLSPESLRVNAAELQSQAADLTEQAKGYRLLAADLRQKAEADEPADDAPDADEIGAEAEKEIENMLGAQDYERMAIEAEEKAAELVAKAEKELAEAEKLEQTQSKEKEISALRGKASALHTRIESLKASVEAGKETEAEEGAPSEQELLDEIARLGEEAEEYERLADELEAKASEAVEAAEDAAESIAESIAEGEASAQEETDDAQA